MPRCDLLVQKSFFAAFCSLVKDGPPARRFEPDFK